MINAGVSRCGSVIILSHLASSAAFVATKTNPQATSFSCSGLKHMGRAGVKRRGLVVVRWPIYCFSSLIGTVVV